MPNKPLRYRLPPEVHSAADTLQSRGVDVGALVGRTLLDAAQEESALVQWAQAQGLRARKTLLVDRDGFVVSVVTNGSGGAWVDGGPRVVCSFIYVPLRQRWTVSATRVVDGTEQLNMSGPYIPVDLPVDRWIALAEGLLPKEGA